MSIFKGLIKDNFMKPTLAIYGIPDRNNYPSPGYVHDHNLTVMQDGKISLCLQLERMTQKKHDHLMPLYLEKIWDMGILPKDFDVVFVDSFAGRSFISQFGRIRFEIGPTEILQSDLEPGFCWWDGKEMTSFCLNHELAHIFSCVPFYGHFKDNSLLVHFDGGASKGNFSAWFYCFGRLHQLEYHWQLSKLSKYFNDNALTFGILGHKSSEHLSMPGKLMGYAAYGTYKPEILSWLERNKYFFNIWSDKRAFFESAKKEFGWKGESLDQKDKFLQDIAATFQYDFEKNLLEKLKEIQGKVHADYLYMSGGCALNIQSNMKIAHSGIFKDIFVPPCCNDSGLSLGAATFMEIKKGNKILEHLPYLNNFQLNENSINYTSETVTNVANLLLQNKIIGIANGYGEIGPRALGNRSLLALANSKQLSNKLSMECKKREWYRPIAPIMLEKNAKKVTGETNISKLADYMLLDFVIKPDFRKELEGVIHINGTSRIQVLRNRFQNPFLYDILEYLDNNHQILALINTSFNIKGEPIVHTSEQALASGKKMGIDAIVLNGKIIHLA